jgi:hypothetical protein
VGRATGAALMLLDVLAKNLAARFILRKDGEQTREPISLRFSRGIHPKAATEAWAMSAATFSVFASRPLRKTIAPTSATG